MAECQLRWQNRNLTSAENPKLATARKPIRSSNILVVYPRLNQGEWFIPNTSWTPRWVVEHRASEKYTAPIASSYKKQKQTKSVRIRFGGWGSRLHQIHCYWIFGGGLSSQILAFSYRKSIINKGYTEIHEENPKRKRGGEPEAGKKYIKNENLPYKKSHEKLNTSRGVIRIRKLSLATEEEISIAVGKQGVTNIKRITIRKEEKIETITYILTFNKPHISKEVKKCYCVESVE